MFTASPILAALFTREEDEVVLRYGIEPAMEEMVEPLTNNDIRDIMIKESIKKIGFCACPFSTDALGGQCGTLSAYYDPWNKSLCYRRDITNEEVQFYRIARAMNVYEAQRRKAEEEADAANKSTKKKKDPTASYFRNNAKPVAVPIKTLLPSNGENLDTDELETTAKSPADTYFSNTAEKPVNPKSTMPYQGFNDLVVPPTPTSSP